MDPTTLSPSERVTYGLIQMTLDAGVPLLVPSLRALSWQELNWQAQTAMQTIAAHGDNILYRS